jgi:ubiquinone/menaquinone biosynthesis C-methylase UbiE
MKRPAKSQSRGVLWFLDKVFRRLGYGFVRYDRVLPFGVSLETHKIVPNEGYVSGPLSHFLLVPKNRYKITPLPGVGDLPDRAIGWIVESNTPESYDRLWGDPVNLARYRTEAANIRTRLNKIMAGYIASLASDDQSILEIGCGPGDLLAGVLALKPSLKVWGFDFSKKAVELAQALIPAGSFIHFHFAGELPYEKGSFDMAFFIDVLEHVDHPDKLVAEALRVIKPGGTLFILAPDGDRDDFIGHKWFWNRAQLAAFLSPWNGRMVNIEGIEESAAIIVKPADTPVGARS